VNRTAQQRGMQLVGQQVLLGQQFATALGLCNTLFGQVDVHPAGEQIEGVPFALAVAEQDELVGHGVILTTRTGL